MGGALPRTGALRLVLPALGLAAAGLAAPAAADENALWRIVHGQCVVEAEAGAALQPPCERVDLARGEREGMAIIKDLVGRAQMLAIPTRRIAGLEDPQMLAPDAPDAFAAAWAARDLVAARLKRPLAREATAIAINSQWARSQQQLHIHVDCLDRQVSAALVADAASIDMTWRAMATPLEGRVYFARRVDSADLVGVNPIRLLADGLDGAKGHLDIMSLAAVGATFGGKPGFILLADRFSLEGGGHAEDLEDHACAIAGADP